MVGDMVIRIGDKLINIGEIAYIEKPRGALEIDGFVTITILFKGGKEKVISIPEKSYNNFMEYYKSLCPDIDDDYTRNMMIQHIMSQRANLVKKMMDEGRLPKSDFPDQFDGGMGRKP